MIETVAVVLLLATVGAWVGVATPQLVAAWVGFARELDPTRATQHAVLFAPTSHGHP